MPRADPPGRTGRNPKQGHRLGRAMLAVPVLASFGWWANKAADLPRDLPLPEPVPGRRSTLDGAAGQLAMYDAAPAADTGARPLLLIHSINAAASAYEVRPLFIHYANTRPVFAIDLPGYGLSERSDRLYTPRLMTDAVLAAVEAVRLRHGGQPVDALALSLSSEFLARAAVEHPDLFHSVGFISPTGFDKRGPRLGTPGSNRGMPAVYRAVTVPLWRRRLFELLTSRVSIRYFLEKTFGSSDVDAGLLDYDYQTAHQPGAEHAPYAFVSGFLFSNDITRVYDDLALPVWMAHGTRGDFQDYSGKTRVQDRQNWVVDVFETGALPQFEALRPLAERYHAFLSRLDHPAT